VTHAYNVHDGVPPPSLPEPGLPRDALDKIKASHGLRSSVLGPRNAGQPTSQDVLKVSKAETDALPHLMKVVGETITGEFILMANATPYSEVMQVAHDWLNVFAKYRGVPPVNLADSRMNLPKSAFRTSINNGYYSLHEGPILGVVRIFAIPEMFKVPPRARVINWTYTVNLWEAGKPDLKLPTQEDVRRLLWSGDHAFSIDGKACFNQFPYGDGVKAYFCVFFEGQWYHLNRLAMGQRQAVMIAQTSLLVLSYECRCDHLVYVDGLLAAGSKADLRADLVGIAERSKKVNFTWNEAVDDPDSLIKHDAEFTGLVLDFAAKTVKLTKKVLAKVALNWDCRSEWDIRQFVVHICLLNYSYLATTRDPGAFQSALQIWARFQGILSIDPSKGSHGPQSWEDLRIWTQIVLENVPVYIAEIVKHLSDWIIITDASGVWGWSGAIINRKTGQTSVFTQRWPSPEYYEYIKSSAQAEPLGLVGVCNSFFVPGATGTVEYLGDNSGFIGTVNKRYSTARGQFAMEYLANAHPGLKFAGRHVAGSDIPMDAGSRGFPLDPEGFRKWVLEHCDIDISSIREVILS